VRIAKSLNLALNILIHSKLRSWLTIIGIVIGVAAVVAIVSLGEGMQQSIESRLGDFGADIITITPGGSQATSGFKGMRSQETSKTTSSTAENITKRDIQIIQSVGKIDVVYGSVFGSGSIYYLGESTSKTITGVDPVAWKAVTTSELESGRFLGPSDYSAVVVGSKIAEGTFKQPLAINRVITIEDKSFKIVGILAEGTETNSIIMPINAARDTIGGIGDEKFSSITVKVSDEQYIDQVMGAIDDKLMLSRHVNEKTKDYSISSSKELQENISDITGTMTMFLGAIAAVSLLVGAVGIANTMFTSVLEKTKEIGIMKSIGAKNRDIMLIFVLNSALVGIVGGILGIALGSGISALIPLLGIRMMGPGGMMNTIISPKLLGVALLIAVTIGVVAGAIPAYRASKLKPVDALRYE